MKTNGLASILHDGWANILTGLGVLGKDKRMASEAVWRPLGEADAEALYAGSDIAGKIVDILPEDALREGYDLKGLDPKQVKKIDGERVRLNVDAKFEEAWKWARTYGGAGLLMVADDTDDLTTPLNPARVTTVKALIPLTRYEIVYTGSVEDDITNPNFGKPRTYQFNPKGGAGQKTGMQIHHSRVIRFDGVPLPPRLFVQNNYWGDSVLTRCYNAIRNYDSSFDAAALALQDFRVGVFKLKNLTQLVANGEDAKVIKRLQIIQQAKSVARAIVIDENESWEEKSTTFAGIPDILGKMKERLQAAAERMPHTKLFGDSPTGMGATGRHEEVNWYDHVSSRQEQYLKPRLLQLYRIVAAQKSVGLPLLPEEFDLAFRPLWQMDEKEIAEIRAKQSETDQRYVDMTVLDPQEIREARFAGETYSMETKVEEGSAPPPPPEVQ